MDGGEIVFWAAAGICAALLWLYQRLQGATIARAVTITLVYFAVQLFIIAGPDLITCP